MVAEMLNTYYGERLAPEHMYTPARSTPMSPPTGQSPPTEAIRSNHHLPSDQCYPLVFQRPVWGHEHCFSYLPPRPPAYSPDVMTRTLNNSCPNPNFYRKDLNDSSVHSGYYCPEQSKTAMYINQHSNDHTSEETRSSSEESGLGVVEKPFTSGSVSDSSSPGHTLAFNEHSLDSHGQRGEDLSEQLCSRKMVQKPSVLVREFSHRKILAVPRNISNGLEMIQPPGSDNGYNSSSPTLSEKSAVHAVVKQDARSQEKPKKPLIPNSTELPKDLSKTSPTSPVIQPRSPRAPFQGSGGADNATPKGRRKGAAGVKRKASVDGPAAKCPKHEDQHVLAPGQNECLLWACKLCKQTAVKAAVKRKVATVRERQRVKILNEAYDVLKNVCSCNPDPRQPKLEILQSAIRYIESLKGILHVSAGCDWDSSESRALINSPYVNEPFQQYGEKSNLSSSSESSDSSTNVSSLDSLTQIVQRINPNTKSLLTAITKNPEAHER